LSESRVPEAGLTESDGPAVEAATKASTKTSWAEAAAEATKMMETAEPAEMVESSAQQQAERASLSARPC